LKQPIFSCDISQGIKIASSVGCIDMWDAVLIPMDANKVALVPELGGMVAREKIVGAKCHSSEKDH